MASELFDVLSLAYPETPNADIYPISPLTFLLRVVWDETAPLDKRMEAATLALPYCHAMIDSNDYDTAQEINGLMKAFLNQRTIS